MITLSDKTFTSKVQPDGGKTATLLPGKCSCFVLTVIIVMAGTAHFTFLLVSKFIKERLFFRGKMPKSAAFSDSKALYFKI